MTKKLYVPLTIKEVEKLIEYHNFTSQYDDKKNEYDIERSEELQSIIDSILNHADNTIINVEIKEIEELKVLAEYNAKKASELSNAKDVYAKNNYFVFYKKANMYAKKCNELLGKTETRNNSETINEPVEKYVDKTETQSNSNDLVKNIEEEALHYGTSKNEDVISQLLQNDVEYPDDSVVDQNTIEAKDIETENSVVPNIYTMIKEKSSNNNNNIENEEESIDYTEDENEMYTDKQEESSIEGENVKFNENNCEEPNESENNVMNQALSQKDQKINELEEKIKTLEKCKKKSSAKKKTPFGMKIALVVLLISTTLVSIQDYILYNRNIKMQEIVNSYANGSSSKDATISDLEAKVEELNKINAELIENSTITTEETITDAGKSSNEGNSEDETQSETNNTD